MTFEAKKALENLLFNNLIKGRIQIHSYDGCKENIEVSMSFDDIIINGNTALFYDTEDNTRAELTGMITLPLSDIEEVHFTDDITGDNEIYGKYNILIILKNGKEVLLSFDMKDHADTPYVYDNDTALSYAYVADTVPQLNYFIDKPVKINLSCMSCFSTYDSDNCSYANPRYASLHIEAFHYEYKNIDGIHCITISDSKNGNINLTLNAIECVYECNIGAGKTDKKIFHFESEVGLITVMDKDYILSKAAVA